MDTLTPESLISTSETDDPNTTNTIASQNIPYNNENDMIRGEHNVTIDKEHNNAEKVLPPRIRNPPQHLKDFYCYNMHSNIKYPISKFVNYDTFSQNHKAYLAAISNTEEPTSYTQAIKLQVWQDVMAHELQALEDNKI